MENIYIIRTIYYNDKTYQFYRIEKGIYNNILCHAIDTVYRTQAEAIAYAKEKNIKISGVYDDMYKLHF